MAEAVQQAIIKLSEPRVDRFRWPATEMNGDPLLAAIKLTLVKEAQARGKKGQDCSRLVNLRGKRRRSTRFVVILQEAT